MFANEDNKINCTILFNLLQIHSQKNYFFPAEGCEHLYCNISPSTSKYDDVW